MKNKKTLYFLAPAVLLVWSLIIYQVSDGMKGGNTYYTGPGAGGTVQVSTAVDSFHYSLLLDYPDPFLGKLSAAPRTATVAAVHAEAKPAIQASPSATVQETPHNLARYSYFGLIEHKGKKDKLALIVVDGTSLMLREGEAAHDLQLLKINPDSVLLKSGKEVFYVKR